MKNLLFLLAFASILCTSCRDDGVDNKKTNQRVLYVPEGKPAGIISIEEAAQLESYYKQEFYGAINNLKATQYPNYDGAVRDIWFDLDELKQYIYYVETQAKKKGYKNLGLRIYFGAKDQLGQDGKVYPRQTVFFVPTANPTADTKTQTGGAQLSVKAEQDFSDNKNILSIDRLNYGGAGVPDDTDQDEGLQ